MLLVTPFEYQPENWLRVYRSISQHALNILTQKPRRIRDIKTITYKAFPKGGERRVRDNRRVCQSISAGWSVVLIAALSGSLRGVDILTCHVTTLYVHASHPTVQAITLSRIDSVSFWHTIHANSYTCHSCYLKDDRSKVCCRFLQSPKIVIRVTQEPSRSYTIYLHFAEVRRHSNGK